MSHVVLKKSLAKALMDAGMENFDFGGFVGSIPSAVASPFKSVAAGFTQDNTFQAGAPNITTKDFIPRINTLQGQQNDVYAQQQSLAQALLAQSRGEGPNPALAQLNQATGQNVAAQNALMAGQRGASFNPALIARLAAQQGAQTQQQAVGQGAILQAQQQLAAQQALAQQQQQMQQQALQGESNQLGGLASQNSAITAGSLGSQQLAANIMAQNVANQNMATGQLLSGTMGAGAMAMSPSKKAKGGMIDHYADGGVTPYAMTPMNPGLGLAPIVPQSPFTQAIDNAKEMGKLAAAYFTGGASVPLTGGMSGGASSSGAIMSPGIVSQDEAPQFGTQNPFMAHGGLAGPTDFTQGGAVPGQANVPGDDEANDTHLALVSPGEAVIPRSIMESPDADKKAAEFIRSLKGQTKKKSLAQRVDELEKLFCGGKVRK